MGILAGAKQSRGTTSFTVPAVGSTSGTRTFFEYNTASLYIIGNTSISPTGNGTDAFVAKYNASGVLQWQRTIGGTVTESANAVYADTNGNVYVVGSTTSQGSGGTDALIVKYDASGVLQWQKAWGSGNTEIAYGVYADTNRVFITGSASSFVAGGSDVFVLQLDINGNTTWSKAYYTSSNDVGTGITYDPYGRIVISGTSQAIGGTISPFVTFVNNSNGQNEAGYLYYTGNTEYSTNVITNVADNGIYFTGNFLGNSYSHLTKYLNTTFQWTTVLSGGSIMKGLGLSHDRFANIYVVGTTGASSYFVVKYDNGGGLQWQRSLTGTGLAINDIWVDYNPSGLASRDVFYLVGTKTSGSTTTASVIKLPQNGSGTGTYSDYTYAVSSLSSGNSPSLNSYNNGQYLSMSNSNLTFTNTTLTSTASTLTSSSATSGFYTFGGAGSIGSNSITTNITGQYTIHTFTGFTTCTFTPASTGFIDILAVGAGGDCGAPGPGPSGGGGGGAAVYKKFVGVTSGTSYQIGIGFTTLNGSGGNTIFNVPGVGVASITAFGGGFGGSGTSAGPAGSSPNASGGGASPAPSTAGVGFGASTFGYPGGNASPTHSGGGGGAGSIGGDSPGSAPGLGGSGVPIAYFTGISTDIVSAGGGPGVTPANYGNGGQSSTPGTSKGGVLYIRYI